MLASLFEQLSSAMARVLENALNTFIACFALDLSAYVAVFPILGQIYELIRSFSVGLAAIIAAIGIAKYVTGVMESNRLNDSPSGILIRTFFSVALIFFGGNICEYIVQLGKIPYDKFAAIDAINRDGDIVINTVDFIGSAAEDLFVRGKAISNLAVGIGEMILTVMLGWNICKLILEICERWLMVGVLVYTSPLAFATIPSSDTSQIFKRWVSMFVGSVIQMSISVIFLKLILNGFDKNSVTSTAGVVAYAIAGQTNTTPNLVKMLSILAMCKIAQRSDTYLQQLGVGVPTTGGSMLDDIVAASKALGGGAKSIANGIGAKSLGEAASRGGVLGASAKLTASLAKNLPGGKALSAMGQAAKDGKGLKDILGTGASTYGNEAAKAVGVKPKQKDGNVTAGGGGGKGATSKGNTPPGGGANATSGGKTTKQTSQSDASKAAKPGEGKPGEGKSDKSAQGADVKDTSKTPHPEAGTNPEPKDKEVKDSEKAADAKNQEHAPGVPPVGVGDQEGITAGGGPQKGDAQDDDKKSEQSEQGQDKLSDKTDPEGSLNPEAAAAAAAAATMTHNDADMSPGMEAAAEAEKSEEQKEADAQAAAARAEAEAKAEQQRVNDSDREFAAGDAQQNGYFDKDGAWHDVEDNGSGGWQNKDGSQLPEDAKVVSAQNGYSALEQRPDGSFVDKSGREFKADNPTYTNKDGKTVPLPNGATVSQGLEGQPPKGTMMDAKGNAIVGQNGKPVTASDVNWGKMTSTDGTNTSTTSAYTGADGKLHTLPESAKLDSDGHYVDANGQKITGANGLPITQGDVQQVAPVQKQTTGPSSVYTGADGQAHTLPAGAKLDAGGGYVDSGGNAIVGQGGKQVTPGDVHQEAGNVSYKPLAAMAAPSEASSEITQGSVKTTGTPSQQPQSTTFSTPSKGAFSTPQSTNPPHEPAQKTASTIQTTTMPHESAPQNTGYAPSRMSGSTVVAAPISVGAAAVESDRAASTKQAAESFRQADSTKDYGGGYDERQQAEAPHREAHSEPPRQEEAQHTDRTQHNNDSDNVVYGEPVESTLGQEYSAKVKDWVASNYEIPKDMRQWSGAVQDYYRNVGDSIMRDLFPSYRTRQDMNNGLEWDQDMADYKHNLNSTIGEDRAQKYGFGNSPLPVDIEEKIDNGNFKANQNQMNQNLINYGMGNCFGKADQDAGEEVLDKKMVAAGCQIVQYENESGVTSEIIQTKTGDTLALEAMAHRFFNGKYYDQLSKSAGDWIGQEEIVGNTVRGMPTDAKERALNIQVEQGEVYSSAALKTAVSDVLDGLLPKGCTIDDVSMHAADVRKDDGKGHTHFNPGNVINVNYTNANGEKHKLQVFNDVALTQSSSKDVKNMSEFRSKSGGVYGFYSSEGFGDTYAEKSGPQNKIARGMVNFFNNIRTGRGFFAGKKQQ